MRARFHVSLAVAALVAAFSALACSKGTEGQATGATCPPASTLTYANFGQPFMDKYCLSCHAGKDRPSLSTQAQIKAEIDGIMKTTASGPTGTNDSMPEDQDVSVEERTQLGEWLACGAP